MRVPVPLVNYFKTEFEPLLTQFLLDQEMIPDAEALHNKRFLNRSVAPHVETLSQLFNRIEKDSQTDGIDTETYWSGAGSPKNRRLAYFLSFMPGNIFRVASVWAELHRLGFKWASGVATGATEFRALEWGAGTAAGACGIIAAEKFAPLGIPQSGSFALIEQSKAALALGTQWFETFSKGLGLNFSPRSFHRRVDLSEPWLPKTAPKFHLFIMSYFLNEAETPPATLARRCLEACDLHLEEEGVVVIVEPALKLQSRKLLEFRRALVEQISKTTSESSPSAPMKVLLPCMGHQACGALGKPEDWCHEEVSWWRPGYLQELDSIVKLDRKSLPFSYLVLQKTRRSVEEILPALQGKPEARYRLVSPSRALGKKDLEFYICGQEGKRRARYRLGGDNLDFEEIDRGDILQNTQLHGEHQLTQIDQTDLVKEPKK